MHETLNSLRYMTKFCAKMQLPVCGVVYDTLILCWKAPMRQLWSGLRCIARQKYLVLASPSSINTLRAGT